MDKVFQLQKNGTTTGRELIAGATTFFTMVYIIFVNPNILSATGMPKDAVFVATIIATVVGTLFMGLFANVPYALAPGMGLNAFFTYTVCFALGFKWQEALALVFICGIINILITVTKVRKSIIKSIPKPLQYAIGGGIGMFIAYIGIKDGSLLKFTVNPGTYLFLGTAPADATVIADASAVPGLVNFTSMAAILTLIGLAIMIILLAMKVKGAILIGIGASTLIGIPMGVTNLAPLANFSFAGIVESISSVKETAFSLFGNPGFQSLFEDPARVFLVIITIIAFSLSDTFDTIGTFIGTGRKAGIFDEADEKALTEGKGFASKMDKALFADSIATSVGALFGTSNTTTYIESAAGIEAGGRTGLTSVFTAILFALCIFFAPIVGVVPMAATAPALIVVGIMMAESLGKVNWSSFSEAAPAFLTAIIMTFAYNISYGIAFGFIAFCVIKLVTGKIKEIHPILAGSAILFILNFVFLAIKNL